jgi:hypothetical protein
MSKKSNANKSILKVAKLAGLNSQIAVLEAHNEQLDKVSPLSITFRNEDCAVKMDAKKLGKTLRKFRDDCMEHIQMDISTVGKKDDAGVGQLFIAFLRLDNYGVAHLNIKYDFWQLCFTDKGLGKLIRKFRDHLIKTMEQNVAHFTKLDDAWVGEEFFTFVNNTTTATA